MYSLPCHVCHHVSFLDKNTWNISFQIYTSTNYKMLRTILLLILSHSSTSKSQPVNTIAAIVARYCIQDVRDETDNYIATYISNPHTVLNSGITHFPFRVRVLNCE